MLPVKHTAICVASRSCNPIITPIGESFPFRYDALAPVQTLPSQFQNDTLPMWRCCSRSSSPPRTSRPRPAPPQTQSAVTYAVNDGARRWVVTAWRDARTETGLPPVWVHHGPKGPPGPSIWPRWRLSISATTWAMVSVRTSPGSEKDGNSYELPNPGPPSGGNGWGDIGNRGRAKGANDAALGESPAGLGLWPVPGARSLAGAAASPAKDATAGPDR